MPGHVASAVAVDAAGISTSREPRPTPPENCSRLLAAEAKLGKAKRVMAVLAEATRGSPSPSRRAGFTAWRVPAARSVSPQLRSLSPQLQPHRAPSCDRTRSPGFVESLRRYESDSAAPMGKTRAATRISSCARRVVANGASSAKTLAVSSTRISSIEAITSQCEFEEPENDDHAAILSNSCNKQVSTGESYTVARHEEHRALSVAAAAAVEAGHIVVQTGVEARQRLPQPRPQKFNRLRPPAVRAPKISSALRQPNDSFPISISAGACACAGSQVSSCTEHDAGPSTPPVPMLPASAETWDANATTISAAVAAGVSAAIAAIAAAGLATPAESERKCCNGAAAAGRLVGDTESMDGATKPNTTGIVDCVGESGRENIPDADRTPQSTLTAAAADAAAGSALAAAVAGFKTEADSCSYPLSARSSSSAAFTAGQQGNYAHAGSVDRYSSQPSCISKETLLKRTAASTTTTTTVPPSREHSARLIGFLQPAEVAANLARALSLGSVLTQDDHFSVNSSPAPRSDDHLESRMEKQATAQLATTPTNLSAARSALVENSLDNLLPAPSFKEQLKLSVEKQSNAQLPTSALFRGSSHGETSSEKCWAGPPLEKQPEPPAEKLPTNASACGLARGEHSPWISAWRAPRRLLSEEQQGLSLETHLLSELPTTTSGCIPLLPTAIPNSLRHLQSEIHMLNEQVKHLQTG